MDSDWRSKAKCKDVPPEIFFPETKAEKVENLPKAKAICNSCSVKEPCLDYALALSASDAQGIWAGTEKDERARLRRQRRRKAG